jgi:hypothetical protein
VWKPFSDLIVGIQGELLQEDWVTKGFKKHKKKHFMD